METSSKQLEETTCYIRSHPIPIKEAEAEYDQLVEEMYNEEDVWWNK